MIRRAGENISAFEVESVVGGIEGVAEVAALPVSDDIRGEEVKDLRCPAEWLYAARSDT